MKKQIVFHSTINLSTYCYLQSEDEDFDGFDDDDEDDDDNDGFDDEGDIDCEDDEHSEFSKLKNDGHP